MQEVTTEMFQKEVLQLELKVHRSKILKSKFKKGCHWQPTFFMDNHIFQRKTFKYGAPLWFIINALLNYKFKSFKRFLIYIFHYSSLIDLREKKSSEYTNEQIIEILNYIFPEKIEKEYLRQITNLNNNTFNKRFQNLFEQNGYVGRKKFTLLETYYILNEWQGNGNWSMMEAIKKEKLAEIISSGNYKNLASEFGTKIGKSNYKSQDKFSPKEVKELLDHIDLTESEEANKLLKQKKFKSMSLWVFGILITHKVLETNKHKTQLSI